MTAPLWVRGVEARRILGIGRDLMSRWTHDAKCDRRRCRRDNCGWLPSRVDPDTGTRWYSVPALHNHANTRENNP